MPATYNERSWAIDLIAHLNRLLAEQRLGIERAGGEHTVRDEAGTLFPDVLLFGDRAGQAILQGWELKMPDTPVTDSELIGNAERKARGLGLNSFLVWNVDQAVLYVAGDDLDAYEPEKGWPLPGGPAGERGNVAARRDDWEALAETILQDVSRLFDAGALRERTLVDAFSDHALIEAFFESVPATVEQFRNVARQDNRFEAEVDLWWSQVEKEYGEGDRLDVLARRALMGWISKFVFAHVIKTTCAEARRLEELDEDATPADAREAFDRISQACNFLNIFREQRGENHVAGRTWAQLQQINGFFSELDLEAVGTETTQALLQSTTSAAKRKAAGQFTTPPALARLLVRVAVRDRTGVVLDPCCGTGTIPAAAYEEKRDAGQRAKRCAPCGRATSLPFRCIRPRCVASLRVG